MIKIHMKMKKIFRININNFFEKKREYGYINIQFQFEYMISLPLIIVIKR